MLSRLFSMPKALRLPTGRVWSNVAPFVPVTYSLNFNTASVENPLSLGGVWSNNTQGVGGNVAPTTFTNLQVAAAFSGGINIACATTVNDLSYDDGFAFVPNVSNGNMEVIATIYIAAGYNPNAAGGNHEIELLLCCKTTGVDNHEWIEFLVDSGGNNNIVRQFGAKGNFTALGGTITAIVPTDGMIFRATRVGDTYTSYLNGTAIASVTSVQTNLGNGAGLATFWRSTGTGSPANNKFGFKDVLVRAI